MALFVEGMPCSICGRPMMNSQMLRGFRPFVANHLDPLYFFSDAVFHAECFDRHPLADKALARWEELEAHTRAWPPPCAICGRTIRDPDDFFTFGHLTGDEAEPLYAYNYVSMHLSCMHEWPELSRARRLLEDLERSGTWKGPGLGQMIGEMRTSGGDR